jgi:hypothetical protein
LCGFGGAGLAAAAWCVAYGLELATTGRASREMWGDLQYVGATLLPAAWLTLVLTYAGRRRHPRRRLLLLLAVEPVILLFLLLLPASHDLVRSFPPGPVPPIPIVRLGPVYWAHFAYTNLLAMVATVLLALPVAGLLQTWEFEPPESAPNASSAGSRTTSSSPNCPTGGCLRSDSRRRSRGLDDFGVGHTSLTHLRRLPVEMLKLDRELTAGVGRDADDTGIVSAITTLAHILGMTVLAEGVERPEQVIGLRQAGCDAAQGFLFSRPLHPDVAAEWLPDPVRTAVPWLARG